VVIKGRALAHLSKKKKSKNPQNSSLFLWFFDSFIFKICTKFTALLTKGVFEMASKHFSAIALQDYQASDAAV
jgi:hypothetical protein